MAQHNHNIEAHRTSTENFININHFSAGHVYNGVELGQLLSGVTLSLYWAQWCLKSQASRLFAQPFVQAQINENIKSARHWPLWGESSDDQ